MATINPFMRFALAVCVVIATFVPNAWAAGAPSSAAIEKLQDRQSQLDKDVAVARERADARIEAQDKRIADLSITIGQQANYIAWTSAAITVITIVAGVLTYYSVKGKAQSEAREASSEWFDKNASELQRKIAELRSAVDDALNHVSSQRAEFASALRQQQDAVANAAKEFLNAPVRDKLKESGAAVAATTRSALSTLRDKLEQMPESEYTASDHFSRGLASAAEGKWAVALDWFDKAVGASAGESAQDRAKYLLLKGYSLGQLERSEEEIEVYDQVIQRFGEDATPALREQVAMAMVNKGYLLGQLNRSEGAIAVYDEVIQRFGQDKEAALREQVAMAMVNKGITLGQLNRSEDEIAVYDEVIQRFWQDKEAALREQVAKAMVNKGYLLGQLNRSEDEIAVYDEVIRRFGQDKEAALRERVARAANGKSFAQIMLAKRSTDTEQQRRLLQEAIDSLLLRLELSEDAEQQAMMHGNLGYAAWLVGNEALARKHTEICLTLGGESLLAAQRNDASLHRLEPQDAAYEALLDEIWQRVKPSDAG